MFFFPVKQPMKNVSTKVNLFTLKRSYLERFSKIALTIRSSFIEAIGQFPKRHFLDGHFPDGLFADGQFPEDISATDSSPKCPPGNFPETIGY